MEGVLVSMVGGRSGDSKGVTTVVEDGLVMKMDDPGREGTIGGRDVDDAETVMDVVRHSQLLQLGV